MGSTGTSTQCSPAPDTAVTSLPQVLVTVTVGVPAPSPSTSRVAGAVVSGRSRASSTRPRPGGPATPMVPRPNSHR